MKHIRKIGTSALREALTPTRSSEAEKGGLVAATGKVQVPTGKRPPLYGASKR